MTNSTLAALQADMNDSSKKEIAQLGGEGTYRLLDEGRKWKLAPTLRKGGTLLFPHASMKVCGHQIAAVVHAVSIAVRSAYWLSVSFTR